MAKRINAGGVTKGSWTEAEDNILRKEVRIRGDDELCNGWAEIAENIPGRTAKQCRERWVQNLKPSLERGPISQLEGDFIKRQVIAMGPKWAEIARQLRSQGISVRSDNAVKNWFNGNKNRQKRAMRRGGREAHDVEMHAGPSQRSHATLDRRSSFHAPAAAAASEYSPLPSPSTPSFYSHSSRPTSQQSSGQYHHHYHHSHQYSPRQTQTTQLPLPSISPRQLPLPQPTFGSSRYFEERRGSVYTVANSPAAASDVTMPPLEPDTGSPLIATSQHSPALSQAPGPQTYSLSVYHGYNGCSNQDDLPQGMMRSLSQQSSQSLPREYSEVMEPSFAPAPPGSERLAISNILN